MRPGGSNLDRHTRSKWVRIQPALTSDKGGLKQNRWGCHAGPPAARPISASGLHPGLRLHHSWLGQLDSVRCLTSV
jgi:hypothetical protein